MPAGRPDKLTEERHEHMMNLFRNGASNSVAADMSGISEKTIYTWLEKGKADEKEGNDTKFARFLHDFKKHKGSYDFKNIDIISEAAETQWQAAAWMLERRRPKEFGRNISTIKDVKFQHENRDDFITQLFSLVGDGDITIDDAMKLAKIKFDSDSTEFKTEFMTRLKALEDE
jgi:hypothetical protein